MNVLKYQHNVNFILMTNQSHVCLLAQTTDKAFRHHPEYNSYTDLLSVQLLLCRVVNCSPVHHLSLIFYF